MKIFIADYLPTKNKGEEALLRGIQSLYEERYKQGIEFYVFGPVTKKTSEGNITSFPVDWCYPTYKSPQLFAGRIGLIRKIICTFLFRVGIFPYVSDISKHKEVLDALRESSVILIAHDGFYHTFCTGLGLYLKKLGFQYLVPGTGFKPIPKYGFVNKRADYQFFYNSKVNIVREQTCFDYLSELGLASKTVLLPDMAFYCKSTSEEVVLGNQIAEKYRIQRGTKKINIGLTICENSISFHGSFLTSCNKTETHRDFIARLLDKISEELDCQYYFIPHCIEDGLGNDLVIAQDVQKRMRHNNKVTIIKDDLPVNVLRQLIHNLDFMIGERTHSIINSTSMCTPFFMLTSSLDFRSHDIIGKGIGLPQQIIDLDDPNFDRVSQKIIKGINNRQDIILHLTRYSGIVAKSREKMLTLI